MSVSAPDGTAHSVDRSDPVRSLRCFATADPRPRVHLRTECAPRGGPPAEVLHDVVVLPRVWNVHPRHGDPRPLTDHGRVVGVEMSPAGIDPQRLWEDAGAVHTAAIRALGATVLDDGVDRALGRVAAAHARTSHDLATVATSAFRVGMPGTREGTRLHADQLAAHVVDEARRVVRDLAARARLGLTVVVTAAGGPARPGTDTPDSGLPVTLPRVPRPPAWLEVASPRADLAYLQIRRAVPPVGTVRELAAVLIANQTRFGPYSSIVDDILRFREGLSYLWDCVVDLVRGEFVMLAAPDAGDADRVLSVVRDAHAHDGGTTGPAAGVARRIVRTGLLRRFGSPGTALAAQSEAQRAGLPPRLLAALSAALRDVTAAEVGAALPAVVAAPLAVTLVVPSGRARVT